jgi:hypothetical protein
MCATKLSSLFFFLAVTVLRADSLTFTRDVAPILQRACQECHRPGSIAPMSLLTYKEARPWARAIKEKVVHRQMPPWHIDRNIGISKFKDDPSLTDAEIAIISSWVDQGSLEGNPADMPRPRQFQSLDQWNIGKPDLIVTMPKPYKLKASGQDEFYDIDVDLGLTEDVYVKALQTKPALGFKVVHHAGTNLIEDPEADPVGVFLNGYAPGKNGDVLPENAGRMIKAGSKVHFNLHLHPDGEETLVSISLGLKLYPEGIIPKYVWFTQHMGEVSDDLDIPAGQLVRSDGYYRLPKPAVLTSYQPHFHTRGKAMCMEAIYPDSAPLTNIAPARPGAAQTETLSCVSDYQFGWSITYTYADDVAPLLPAGTMIHVITWHDNRESNRFNPDPKNWVGYGQRTVDEMSFAWVSLFYIDDRDFQQRIEGRKTKKLSD